MAIILLSLSNFAISVNCSILCNSKIPLDVAVWHIHALLIQHEGAHAHKVTPQTVNWTNTSVHQFVPLTNSVLLCKNATPVVAIHTKFK